MDVYSDLKQGERGAWVSIIAYIFCSALKIGVAVLTGSEALMADGLNNSTDVVASIAVLIGLRIARKPPDHDHPYGHFRAETISALVASFIMLFVGLQVVTEAVPSLFDQKTTAPDLLAGWTALATAAIMLGVYRYNRQLALRTNSQALLAAAADNRSDAFVSIGTFVGVAGAQFQLYWLDPLAALVVGVIILKTAWDIFREATHRLTDGFDVEELGELKETISSIAGVKDISDIKARYHGSSVLVDVVIHVEPHLNVVESHTITEHIEERMRRVHKINTVHIHIEPEQQLVEK
ncbi:MULTISPECIES: cation diffusion facilitator family transporter [Brevibacillus]|uniref:Putative transporter YeaB n=1 Tax=Brevibacillus parabrevis TaxID=54914 RepID=A0A4Y3PGH5_BREPA|nr:MULTISPECIES: cation diffusion facilitator family transporter [Brevibacillus]NRQ53576.1 cation transporter [Brevibacillus sp. HD1.4A]MBU8711479.1 cation diffusion facilitator family transporter [Brevibacillus parabrevis]MDH6349892.1 cation diffusion facilitator family transporter [Brevibacillus sp. 1238]MDR4999346.1 cation diffusion facilitator family transporter [Brevibacillus parabrevis]MED2254093.1 cation diffusion facilitator family transporter [Brevibacillus parabrevis]